MYPVWGGTHVLGVTATPPHQIRPDFGERARLHSFGTAEPVARGQILRREQEQEVIHFACSADQEQDRQPHITCFESHEPGNMGTLARQHLVNTRNPAAHASHVVETMRCLDQY